MQSHLLGRNAHHTMQFRAGRARHARAFGVLSALFLAGAASPLVAQLVVAACNMNCPQVRLCLPGDQRCNDYNANAISCQTQQASCQAKFVMYDTYMQQMGAGVTMHQLPALYRDELATYYPAATLAEVRFGYSNRQPEGNATADCDRIYFNDAAYVDAVRTATLKHDSNAPHHFGWLLHELTHFEQCRQVGSRDAYARMWWDQLSETELAGLIESGSWLGIHDQMQMEQQANARRDQTWAMLPTCCIDPTTRLLIKPLTVTPLAISPTSATEGQTVTLSTSASNGAQPLTYRWKVREPGSIQPLSLPADGPTASFAPNAPGTWTVLLAVTQPGNSLQNDYSEQRTLSVAALLPVVTSVSVSPGSVTGGAGAEGTVHVASMKPGVTAQVQLASNHAAVLVPQSVSVTSSSSGAGSATFPITTGLVLGTQTASVTATTASGSASTSLTVTGVSLELLSVNRTVLDAGELLEVLLLLDRAPPVDITVVLGSSHDRVIGLPRQVVFRAGQTRMTVSATVAQDLATVLDVTLHAHTLHDSQTSRNQVIQVRPRR
jgi:hypothetical protein